MTKRTCTIENCANKLKSRELCEKHYNEWINAKYDKRCDISECTNDHYRRGYCKNHYRRWRKHGDPLAGQHRFYNYQERLDAHSVRVGDCLIWTGSKDDNGYGFIAAGGKTRRVHRYIWEQTHGKIPDDRELNHTCWSRDCVEINHLEIVTRAENNWYLSGANRNSSSGVRNVYRNNSGWGVMVGKDWRSHHFGTYQTIEEASVVAERARQELFGDFAGRG